MSSNEFNKNPMIQVSYMNYQPIFITPNIKYNSAICDKVNCSSEYILNVNRSFPISFTNDFIPSLKRSLSH